jgi:hypothetical protein
MPPDLYFAGDRFGGLPAHVMAGTVNDAAGRSAVRLASCTVARASRIRSGARRARSGTLCRQSRRGFFGHPQGTVVTFTIEPWDPAYGMAFNAELDDDAMAKSSAGLDLDEALRATEDGSAAGRSYLAGQDDDKADLEAPVGHGLHRVLGL